MRKNQHQSIGSKKCFLGHYSLQVLFFSQGIRLFSDGFGIFFNVGKAIFQIPFGFSLALVGAGWLIGLGVRFAILLGTILSWGVLTPLLSANNANFLSALNLIPPLYSITSEILENSGTQICKDQVQSIGVGTIGISAVWTLLKMIKPTFLGLKDSFSHSIHPYTQQDLSLPWMIGIFIIFFLILVGMFYQFLAIGNLHPMISWTFILIMSFSSVFIGFLISVTCGYMARFVGSSSGPISGIGILEVILLSLITLDLAKFFSLEVLGGDLHFFIALTLFSTSIIFAIVTIAKIILKTSKPDNLLMQRLGNKRLC